MAISPAKDKFERNLMGKSTYKCVSCGKNTRETGLGESGSELCAFCYEEAGLENSLSDGHITQEQFDEQLAELKRIHKRTETKTAVDPDKMVAEIAAGFGMKMPKKAKKTPQVEPLEGMTALGLSKDGEMVDAEAQPVLPSTEAKATETQAEIISPAQEQAKPVKAKPSAKKAAEAGPLGCTGKQRDGSPCRMPPLKGTNPGTCYNHTPADVKAQMGHKAPAYGEPRTPRWPSATFEGVKVTVKGKSIGSVTVVCRTVDGKPVLEVQA